MQHKTRLKSI